MKLKAIRLLLVPATLMLLVACGGDTASPLPTSTPFPPPATPVPPPTPTQWENEPTSTPPYTWLPMSLEFEIVVVTLDEEQAAQYYKMGRYPNDEPPVTLEYILVAVTNPNDVVGEVWARLQQVDEEGIRYDLADGHHIRLDGIVLPNSKYVDLFIRRQMSRPHDWVLEQLSDSAGGSPSGFTEEFSLNGGVRVDPMDNEFFTIEDIANDEERRWMVNRTDKRIKIGWLCERTSPLVTGGYAFYTPTFQKFPDVTHRIFAIARGLEVEPKTKISVVAESPGSDHQYYPSLDNCDSWWVRALPR